MSFGEQGKAIIPSDSCVLKRLQERNQEKIVHILGKGVN